MDNVARGRRNQKVGKSGEELARILLLQAGVRMVEKIATPYNVIASRKDSRGGSWVKIVHTDKVGGDWRGVLPDGRRVLCEVKVRDRNLRKSDFKAHQLAALAENHRWFGVSLVVWVHPEGSFILRWPLLGFEKERASLRHEQVVGSPDLWVWDGKS